MQTANMHFYILDGSSEARNFFSESRAKWVMNELWLVFKCFESMFFFRAKFSSYRNCLAVEFEDKLNWKGLLGVASFGFTAEICCQVADNRVFEIAVRNLFLKSGRNLRPNFNDGKILTDIIFNLKCALHNLSWSRSPLTLSFLSFGRRSYSYHLVINLLDTWKMSKCKFSFKWVQFSIKFNTFR